MKPSEFLQTILNANPDINTQLNEMYRCFYENGIDEFAEMLQKEQQKKDKFPNLEIEDFEIDNHDDATLKINFLHNDLKNGIFEHHHFSFQYDIRLDKTDKKYNEYELSINDSINIKEKKNKKRVDGSFYEYEEYTNLTKRFGIGFTGITFLSSEYNHGTREYNHILELRMFDDRVYATHAKIKDKDIKDSLNEALSLDKDNVFAHVFDNKPIKQELNDIMYLKEDTHIQLFLDNGYIDKLINILKDDKNIKPISKKLIKND